MEVAGFKVERLIVGETFFDTQSIPIYTDIFTHDNDVASHSHSFFEFVYIDRGFSMHYYNQSTTVLTPGDVFGIRPGDVHGYNRPQQTILYNCMFHPEAVQSEKNEIQKLPGIGKVFSEDSPSVWQRVHLNPISRKDVLEYLDQMKWERINRNSGWELKMKSLLLEFLVVISRAFEDQYKGEGTGEYQYTQYIYQALAYIEQFYNKTIHIEDIAGTIGLSADYFSRLFKQFTGLAPMEYMKNVRLAKAAELLKNPGITVSQVAQEVGIDDPSYFTRQFKQVLGISPSQYQNDYKK